MWEADAGDQEGAGERSAQRLAEEEAFWLGVAEATQESARLQAAARTVQARYRRWRRERLEASDKLLDEVVGRQRRVRAVARARAELRASKQRQQQAPPLLHDSAHAAERQKSVPTGSLSALADKYVQQVQAGQAADELSQVAVCTLLLSIVTALTVLTLLLGLMFISAKMDGTAVAPPGRAAGTDSSAAMLEAYLKQVRFDSWFPESGQALAAVGVALAAGTSIGMLVC